MKTEPMNIYLDEAGNTGQDLLNTDQVVFVLSSNNFSQNELLELTSMFNNGSEIHFKNLKDSEAGRKSIIQFLNHPLITEKNIISSVTHKEFVTVCQIVDQVIEPVMYDNGYDIYQYGENISISNFIFHFGNFFWNKVIYKELLHSFIKMIRFKDKDSVLNFYKTTRKLYNFEKTKERQLLVPILASEGQIGEILERVNKFTIDVTLSSFYIINDFWYRKEKRKLNIYQDDSKQIDSQKEFIEFTKTINIPQQEIGYGSRKMTFPTQIEKLELVSSSEHIGVQVSDLIASSLAFMYSNKKSKQEPFVKEIQKSKLLNLSNYHTIWPSDKITPEELKMETGEGQNILDFLAHEKLKNGI